MEAQASDGRAVRAARAAWVAQVCGGAVLRCLTDKREELSSEACKKEVLYFEKMEVNDYR